jgi:hypothetical protein
VDGEAERGGVARKVSRLAGAPTVAALAFAVIAMTPAGAPAANGCPIHGSVSASKPATELMAALESDFRRGARVVRMDIRTRYARLPRFHHAEAYQPNQRTLWGVFDGGGDVTRLLYVFSGPGRLAGTTLLMHDQVDTGGADAMWLYLRAFNLFKQVEAGTQRVLVPGTALTYEDSRGFIPLDKYRFSEPDGTTPDSGWILGCPRSAEIRAHLGYGSLRMRVDRERKILRSVEYSDVRGKPLKTYILTSEQRVGDRTFPREIQLEHEADGFTTTIIYEYWLPTAPPPSSLFVPGTMEGSFIDRLEAYLAQIGLADRLRAEREEAEARVREFFERLGQSEGGERTGSRPSR